MRVAVRPPGGQPRLKSLLMQVGEGGLAQQLPGYEQNESQRIFPVDH